MLALRRLTYRLYRLLSSARYWVLRRCTAAGMALLGMGLIAGFMSFETDQKVTYQAACLFVALLAAANLGGFRFRLKFSANRTLPRFASVGIPVRYFVEIRNLSNKTQNGLLLLEGLADPRPTVDAFVAWQIAEEKRYHNFRASKQRKRTPITTQIAKIKEVPVPALLPRVPVEISMELTPLKRGYLRLKNISLARPDPLGLFKGLATIRLEQSLLVLPKRYPVPQLSLPGTQRFQQGGVALAGSIGESEEFVSLREYRPGDPLRRVHWKSWARAGKPIVKEFQEEFFVRHALILDTFLGGEVGEEVFEEAVSVAASYACTIETQESLLDLLFVGPQAFCFTTGRGLAHADQMLEILASVSVCRDKKFSTLKELVVNHMSAVSGCICIFVQWDAERSELVKQIRNQGIPLLVLLVVERGGVEFAKTEPGFEIRILEAGKIAEGLSRI